MDKNDAIAVEVGKKIDTLSDRFKKAEIARTLDLDPSRVGKIIKGKSQYLSYFQLYQLNKVYKVDLNELITGEPMKKLLQVSEPSVEYKREPSQIEKDMIETQKKYIATLEEKIRSYEGKE